MLRLLADENFNGRIVRAVRRLDGLIEFATIQSAGLRTRRDSDVLAWAADHDCIVVSHDYSTMGDEAVARIDQGLRMPGLILIDADAPIGPAAYHLYILAAAGVEGDLEGQVVFIQC